MEEEESFVFNYLRNKKPRKRESFIYFSPPPPPPPTPHPPSLAPRAPSPPPPPIGKRGPPIKYPHPRARGPPNAPKPLGAEGLPPPAGPPGPPRVFIFSNLGKRAHRVFFFLDGAGGSVLLVFFFFLLFKIFPIPGSWFFLKKIVAEPKPPQKNPLGKKGWAAPQNKNKTNVSYDYISVFLSF